MSEKILVVDDMPDWLHTTLGVLSDEGIDAVGASSVEEAEKILAEGGVTKVVTDGLEGEWKKVVQAAKELPVTVLTGNSKIKDEEVTATGSKIVRRENFSVDKL